MILRQEIVLFFLCATCIFTLLTLRVYEDSYYVDTHNLGGPFLNFPNETGVSDYIVPNIVHFVFFNKRELDFISFLSMTSAIKIQKPEKLIIHTNLRTLKGKYMTYLLKISNETIVDGKTTIVELSFLEQPQVIFGQRISSVYHASDVARISILSLYGGIYLDTDQIILKSLDKYRHFEMVLGWPENKSMGSQILIAAKGARFLKLWLQSYSFYKPKKWVYNVGYLPTSAILENFPQLIHRVKRKLGVEYIHREIWTTQGWEGWKELDSLHLLIRHPPSPSQVTENDYNKCSCAFSEMATMILHDIPPNITFNS